MVSRFVFQRIYILPVINKRGECSRNYHESFGIADLKIIAGGSVIENGIWNWPKIL